ncbi:MAG: type IX secretion system membrane protein PorP/SprF [Cytophagales bacterium]|jgi:hypothetical protein|nr:type IX secretion system membrane protein PorP/SprF [Cytophagales bacterium]
MHIVFKAGLVWLGIFLSFAGYGQEIPLGVMPMQYNPSFAGEAGVPRLNVHTGVRLPRSQAGYRVDLSYDQFVPKIRSGIGVSVYSNSSLSTYYNRFRPDSASGLTRTTHESRGAAHGFSVAIAPKFSIKGKYTLSPSIDLSYHASESYNELWFTNGTRQDIVSRSVVGRVALLFNSQKWYIGYSINVPLYQAFTYNSSDVYPARRFVSYWQMGCTFQRSAESRFSFTPQVVFLTGHEPRFVLTTFRSFRYFAPVEIILNFRHNKFIWGFNRAGLHVGWQTARMRLMLSQRVYVSSTQSAYLGGVSFRYVFKHSEPGKNRW